MNFFQIVEYILQKLYNSKEFQLKIKRAIAYKNIDKCKSKFSTVFDSYKSVVCFKDNPYFGVK